MSNDANGQQEAARQPEAIEPKDQLKAEPGPEIDWKAKAREWEKRAKDNKSAADELAQLREQQKTAEQKAADREKAAIERAAIAEAKAVRREVALDFGLSKDDASLLDDLTDEDAMKRLAKRLADRDTKDKRKTNRVPGEGTQTPPPSDDRREFIRRLTGRE